MTDSLSIFQRLRRTPYQAVASVFMMFITLFVMGLFLLLVTSTSSLVSYFESKPQLTVFFSNEKDKTSIDKLVNKLMTTGKISSTKYVSKEEKANVITEWFNKNPDPKYINYKHDVEDSDIVEYLDIKQGIKNGNKVLTPNDVAKLLM